jgi:hypothetical protein
LLENRAQCEYPIYVKGLNTCNDIKFDSTDWQIAPSWLKNPALIKRQQGQISESLQLFQAATYLNPHNVANLKQVGRSLYVFVYDF